MKDSVLKSVKIFGLVMFCLGFILFNAMYFLGHYELSENAVAKRIEDSTKRRLFLAEASSLLKNPVESNHQFVQSLSKVFSDVNEKVRDRYRITEDDLQGIINLHQEKFRPASIDSALRPQGETGSFKANMLKEYAGWLEGKTFRTREELRAALQETADKINDYGIAGKVGFDRYQKKDLLFSLTKAAATTPAKTNPWLFFFLTFGLCIGGAMLYIFPKLNAQEGIKNNSIFFNPMKNAGWLGILTGTWLILFYIALYFFPEYMTHWIIMVDPISTFLNGHEAGRFFLYGFIYTLCILVMGVRFMIHYRHTRYQMLRTVSVMFFQTSFAFLIPEILIRLNKPYFDFKNIWPLDYSFFFDSRLDQLIANGTLGIFMLGWGIALIVIAVPVFVYFFGKRWYCSWVCGCGGLAETLGDPYRQLSQKSLKAWKIERWMVHGVLVFAVFMTVAVLYTYFTNQSWFFFIDSYTLREIYGVYIGAGFAGVIGTGFYPLMGNRVWCRYGCPLAAYLGIVQRFKSRFRITTNGGQCISCGNCSTYCEMGIDVRWYAQRGQNIVRASCVGCGICSAVCPRGVLKLEAGDEKGRFGKAELIGNNNV